jgi:hypothetical protein
VKISLPAKIIVNKEGPTAITQKQGETTKITASEEFEIRQSINSNQMETPLIQKILVVEQDKKDIRESNDRVLHQSTQQETLKTEI